MQRLLFCVSFGLGFLLLLWHCQLEENPPAPKVFQSNFSDGLLKPIEQQMYQLQFPQALKQIEKLIEQQNLSDLAQQQAFLQAAFLSLSLEQPAKGWCWIKCFLKASPDSTQWDMSSKAHYNLVKGMAEYQELNLFEAKSTLLKALPLLQKAYTNNHYYVAIALTQLGLILFDIDNTQVLNNEYIERADTIFQYNSDLAKFAWEMHLGKALQAQNDRSFRLAESAVEQALYKYEKLPFTLPIFHGRCLLALGNALKKLEGERNYGSGDFHSADSCLQLAAKLIYPSNSIRLQECYRDLSVLYIQPRFNQQDFQNQIQKLVQLIKAQKRDVFGFPDRLKALYDCIHSKLDLSSSPLVKDTVTAQRIIEAFETFLQKNKNNPYHHRHLDETYFILKRAHALAKNYEKTIYYCQKSTELFHPEKHSSKYQSIVGVPMDTTEVAAWISCGWQAEYQFLAALELSGTAKITQLRKAIELYKLFDAHFFTSILNTHEDGLLGFQNEVGDLIYPNAVGACYEYYQIFKDEQSFNLALQFSERRKSYLLYRDMFKENPDQGSLSDSIRPWQAKWTKLSFMANPDKSERAQWSSINELERKLKQASHLKYRQENKQPIAQLKDIQKQLGANQQVVQYVVGKHQIYILAINKQRHAFSKVKSGHSKRWVKQLVDTLGVDNSFPTSAQRQVYLDLGYKLFTRLVQPVQSVLDSGKTTIIIPDQYLHQLPFSALLKKNIPADAPVNYQKLPYLLLNGPVIYSSSWKVYREKSSRSPKQLAIDQISFWATSKALNNYQIKNSLEKNFTGKPLQIFENADCNRASFLWLLPKLKGLVHISVHAESSLYDRRDNKLHFEPGVPSEDVYGFEISVHTLQHIDLLVLAACQSNFGQMGAEGTFSLTRYFSQAGVGSIVSTLWSVDNVATYPLLVRMYHHLGKKHSLEESLWLAKKDIANDKMINFPGAWAGVVLTK